MFRVTYIKSRLEEVGCIEKGTVLFNYTEWAKPRALDSSKSSKYSVFFVTEKSGRLKTYITRSILHRQSY